jgi:hypothetical protein
LERIAEAVNLMGKHPSCKLFIVRWTKALISIRNRVRMRNSDRLAARAVENAEGKS